MDLLSSFICFLVAIWMALNSKNASRNVDFVISFVIAASFFYSQMHPYFSKFYISLFSSINDLL